MDEDNLETGHSAVPDEVVTSIHGGDTHVMTFLDSAKSATLEKIGAHLLAWERKYHVLWDQDKDIFMRLLINSLKSPSWVAKDENASNC